MLPCSRQSTGSSSRNSRVVSVSQLHHRFCASASSRWCVGATICPCARASRDNRRDLRPRHHQHPHIVGPEGPRFDRLDDEDALQQAAIDDRHAEKRAVRILAGFREVLESGMGGRVGEDLRFEPFGDQAGQAFGQPHADAADAVAAQADGGGEHQARAVGLQQVDRADVGLKALLNEMRDVGQRFRRIAVPRDQAADFLERPQA